MGLENFHLLNDTTNATSSKKKRLQKKDQEGARLNNPDQKTHFNFGHINNYPQIGSAYIQNDISVRTAIAIPGNPMFQGTNVIRVDNIAFAYTVNDARLNKTGYSVLEHKIYVGQVSRIMGILSSKDGDLISYFDEFNETEAETLDSSLEQALKINII